MNPLWESDKLRHADPRDSVLGSLREALRPPPLSELLVREIEAGWASPRIAPSPRRLNWIAAALAAAALATIFVLPAGIRSGERASVLALSKSDADLVLAAFASGRWYGPTDAAIDRLLETVQALSSRVTPAVDDDASEDWDLSPPKDDSTPPGSSRARNDPLAVS
jgi:hypothetical protein